GPLATPPTDPLTAGAQDVHHPIDHRPHIHRSLVTTLLRRRDQRADQRPLLVAPVARVAQLAPVIPRPVLQRPHLPTPANRSSISESQVIHPTQDVPGWTLILQLRIELSFDSLSPGLLGGMDECGIVVGDIAVMGAGTIGTEGVSGAGVRASRTERNRQCIS